MRSLFLLLLVGLIFGSSGHAQDGDLQWWDKKHPHPPNTPRHEILQLSAKYMGPNALPAPFLENGYLNAKSSIENSAQIHANIGDATVNHFVRADYAFVPEKVTLYVYATTVEVYSMDTVTRDFQKSMDRDGKGHAFGDIYVGTKFQLWRKEKHAAQLNIGIKTASGSDLFAARYTDTPGYFFNLTHAHNLVGSKQYARWQLLAMVGFYAYQTHDPIQFQNDAFVYGLGIAHQTSFGRLNAGIRGYVGYRNNGDRPMVAKIEWNSNNHNPWQWLSFVQAGIFDYPFYSLSVGVKYLID